MPDRVELALWGIALVLGVYALALVLGIFGAPPRLAGAYHPDGCTVRPGRPA